MCMLCLVGQDSTHTLTAVIDVSSDIKAAIRDCGSNPYIGMEVVKAITMTDVEKMVRISYL